MGKMKNSILGLTMCHQAFETTVFYQQGFRVRDHGKKGLAANDNQFGSGPRHGHIESVGAV